MHDNLKKVLKSFGIPATITGTSGINNYKNGTLTYLDKPDFIGLVKPNMGATILTDKKMYNLIKEVHGNNYIVVESPAKVFMKIHNIINKKLKMTIELDNSKAEKPIICNNVKIGRDSRVMPNAVIGSNVVIGDYTVIMPNAVIGSNVVIGDYTVIMPNAVICDQAKIGKSCLISSGAIIGEEGFKIIRNEEEKNERMVHTGSVVIGDNVDIGENSTISRGTFLDTTISDFAKIHSLVHVGHNVNIGRNTVICASVCIGGSTKIGNDCFIGIGSTIRNNLNIGNNVKIDINSVVVKDAPDGSHIAGFYAKDRNEWMFKEKEELKRFKLK